MPDPEDHRTRPDGAAGGHAGLACRAARPGGAVGIDDFGTGYSSLAYLSTLQFDCLKIDRSFVIGMQASPQNVEIVRTVLSLGRSLNKLVIAEGIETPAQLECLKRLGARWGRATCSRRRSPRTTCASGC
ncbi:MAG: EAL domain-containing protein [Casimicrobiaceae bacterium]